MVQLSKKIKNFQVDQTWNVEIYEGNSFPDEHKTPTIWKSYELKFYSESGGSIRFMDAFDKIIVFRFNSKSTVLIDCDTIKFEDTNIMPPIS